MKILFLNIMGYALKDPLEKYLEKHKETTDIFCFQEVYDDSSEYLQHLLTGFNNFFTEKDLGGESKFSLNTFVRSNLNIIENIVLLENSDKTGLALHTRIELAERYLNICNVHGIAFPGDKLDNEDRLMQSEEIINHFKNIDTETVIGGDFNLEKQTKSVSMFEESGYRNLVNDFNIKETRNRLAWQKHPDSIQFFADYVFTTKGVSIISFKTESDEISDHLPLVLEINVN